MLQDNCYKNINISLLAYDTSNLTELKLFYGDQSNEPLGFINGGELLDYPTDLGSEELIFIESLSFMAIQRYQ